MKTTQKYELLNALGREISSIFAVKRSQANYRPRGEVPARLCVRQLEEKC